MGKIIIICAMIIADGVYNNLKAPKGPPCANKKYTINPTTTGGIPMKELIIINIVFLK